MANTARDLEFPPRCVSENPSRRIRLAWQGLKGYDFASTQGNLRLSGTGTISPFPPERVRQNVAPLRMRQRIV